MTKILTIKLILAINSAMIDYPKETRQKITACIFYGRVADSFDAVELKQEYGRCKLKYLGKRVSFR